MQFAAEIWRRSEHIQALGNFSKLIGEKSPIRRQRAKYTKYLRSVPQESITGRKINGTIYVHCSGSTDNGFGCLQTLMLCTIQVHPSARLLVDWICTGLGGGGLAAWVEGVTSLHHMNLYRAGLSRDPLYTSFLCTAHLTHNWTLKRSDVTRFTPDFFCREQCICLDILTFGIGFQ